MARKATAGQEEKPRRPGRQPFTEEEARRYREVVAERDRIAAKPRAASDAARYDDDGNNY